VVDSVSIDGTPVQLLFDGSLAQPGLPASELAALLEALLLVAPEPPALEDLAGVMGIPTERLEAVIAEMAADTSRGWIVQRQGSRLHLATAPRFAPYISQFLGLEREGRLSAAALETLAIVAYQQPVTRAEIEAIRGVDCAGVLATLHARELIEPVSRLQAVGNPYQYGTTVGFLQLFGLASLADLPPLGSIDGQDGLTLLADAMASERGDDQVIQVS
jgi:segregation and condensation protein B